MRLNTVRLRLWLGAGVAAIAAIAVTGASGVTGSDTIATIAGSRFAGSSGDGGPATSAQLRPDGVAVDRQGNVYIAERANLRVRKVSPAGKITTMAGPGPGSGPIGDGGPAASARLAFPMGVAVDGQGNVYIADTFNWRVRKVSTSGTITTFAGRGAGGLDSGDGGPATLAQVDSPSAVAVDGQGNVYIAEHGAGHNRVRKVSPAGTITTIAGTGKLGFSGDGGPATSAQLFWPRGLAVDGDGNVYIADAGNHRVRKVSADGTITTIAGTGKPGSSGDGGRATSAQLGGTVAAVPHGLAVDRQGNLYIADTENNRVRKVTPGGTITTIAGTGTRGFTGDGRAASAANLSWPAGLAIDGKGNLYIVDTGNNRVRRVGTTSVPSALNLTLGGASAQRLLAQKGIAVTAGCDKHCSLAATGLVTILGTRHVFGLVRASVNIAAGTRTLTLRLRAAEQKRFRKLLKPGQQARAVITVKASDKAGHTTTSKRTVAVR